MTGIPQGSVQPPFLFLMTNGQPIALSQQDQQQAASSNYVTQLPLMQFPVRELPLVKEQNNAKSLTEQITPSDQRPSYSFDSLSNKPKHYEF